MTSDNMSKSTATDSTELCNSMLLNTACQSRYKQRASNRNGSATGCHTAILWDDVLNSYTMTHWLNYKLQSYQCSVFPLRLSSVVINISFAEIPVGSIGVRDRVAVFKTLDLYVQCYVYHTAYFHYYWRTISVMNHNRHMSLNWLRHYATSRKVAGSNPDGVIIFLNWPNPSSRTMAPGSTQLLTEMSTRNFPGG
jgi:hypothetical protein